MISLSQEEIMQNWGTDNSDTPLVSVRCITYNHEPYIAQALDGFLMQKTNFPFKVIVHDDASTDRTADIIREYEAKFPKIIKPIYEAENQYSKHNGSIARIMNEACTGKYIALCEGDDYWIDPNKLQMQVDFLEQNSAYGLCYSKAKQFFQDKRKFSRLPFGSNIESFEDLLQNGNRIPTLTVCARTDLVRQYYEEIKPAEKKWLMGDYPMWLYVAGKAKIHFIDKKTAVYRVLSESASHSANVEKRIAFSKNVYEIRSFFSARCNCPIQPLSDSDIRFHVYIDLLNEKYTRQYARELRGAFKAMEHKSAKDRLYFLASHSRALWALLRIIIWRKQAA